MQHFDQWLIRRSFYRKRKPFLLAVKVGYTVPFLYLRLGLMKTWVNRLCKILAETNNIQLHVQNDTMFYCNQTFYMCKITLQHTSFLEKNEKNIVLVEVCWLIWPKKTTRKHVYLFFLCSRVVIQLTKHIFSVSVEIVFYHFHLLLCSILHMFYTPRRESI